MASATLVTVGEYLRSSYEPDAEYVDGVIEERPAGEWDHSGLQVGLATLLNTAANRRYFRPFTELRVQVAARRYRVPDVCLVRAGCARVVRGRRSW